MTKIQSTVLGIEAIITLAIVLLSAFALISAEASMSAGKVSKLQTASISPDALHQTVDVSKLPMQEYPAF
jgi:hypothetical protein